MFVNSGLMPAQLAILENTCCQPLADQSDDPAIADPVLEEP